MNFVPDSINGRKSSGMQHHLDTIGEILDRKASKARMLANTVDGLNRAHVLRDSTPENLIFELFRLPDRNEASITRLLKVLRSFGIRECDPRIAHINAYVKECSDDDEDTRRFALGEQHFKELVRPSVKIIAQTLRNQLIIPSWGEFCGEITKMFECCKNINDGKVADYIPQLARVDSNLWGISICTIDGQRFSLGDSNVNFCIQSVSKAFNYAIVSSDIGADKLHSFVGHEPSGRLFNEICLDANGKPHNPMINAGAIVVTALIRNHLTMADRYDFVLNRYKQLAGGASIGFNNATFLSERDTADRNYALSYYMKENKCFPPDTKELREELDLYFQLCSIETNCDTAAVMAATLANGGVCPLTDDFCVDPRSCRDVLSLMYSCGMYDFSGKFAFQVGLPAKSGVSGCMVVVIPNVMGIALYSPPLDKMGNSCKGVAFCKALINTFNFHNYDSLLHADSKKLDPRRRVGNRETELVVALLFAAKNADMASIRRMFMQGTNLDMADYDGRTALHIAAAEGHIDVVKFLTQVANVGCSPKDRWGRTPFDDAEAFRHKKVAEYLKKAQLLFEQDKEEKAELKNETAALDNASLINGNNDPQSGEQNVGVTGLMLSDPAPNAPIRRSASHRVHCRLSEEDGHGDNDNDLNDSEIAL